MMIAGWQILEAATVRRKRLLQAGYLPIPAAGKKPPIAGWTDVVATESIIDGWFHSHPEALNTGILTRTTPAVDVDVYDAEVAQEIEELLWETVGSRGMVRFGQPPKRAILFRTDTPFGKISTPVFTSPTKLQHRVEILCNGQQIIVLGTHPDTGKPYSWYGGEFGDVARADLPDLTEALACEFITKAAAIMRARGWIEEIVRKPNGQNGAHHVVVAGDGDEVDSMYGGREQNYALATLQGCCDELGAMAPNSGRNNKLNALAYRLGTMSGRHWISGDEVSRQLFDAAAKCALVAEDGAASVRATIKSGLKKGEQSPHPDLANDTIDVKAAVVEPPRPDGFPFEYAK